MQSTYITGTDTGIGKTIVSTALLTGLNQRGYHAVGMKPIASGCTRTNDGLRNADALQLIACSRPQPAYALTNPYAFEEAIAPHIAAATTGITIELKSLEHTYAILRSHVDGVVVEGVGGWAVPFSDTLMQTDLVRLLDLPVILVVGLRLGCLNHALLTARSIAADGCRLLGWIGNSVDPHFARYEENLATLRARLEAPCLGVVPFIAGNNRAQAAIFMEDAVSMLS